MLLVLLAGDKRESDLWLKTTNRDLDVIVVNSIRSIEGLRFRPSDVIRIGSWKTRSDLEDIEDIIDRTGVLMGDPIKPCPECQAGKCSNCDGGAWDNVKDQPALCPCAKADHPRKTV